MNESQIKELREIINNIYKELDILHSSSQEDNIEINKLHQKVHSIVIKQKNDGYRSQQDFLIENNVSQYKELKSYSNLIIVAGYASLFTMWNYMKDMINPINSFYVALFLSLSLMIFVIFEVFKMIDGAKYHKKISEILDSFLDEDRLNAYSIFEREYYDRQSRIWLYALVPCVTLGISSGIILIYEFLLYISIYYK